MKNKTKRKSLKKNKKMKGGAKCQICGDRTSTRTEATSVSLCGKPQCRMCIDCARQTCIKGAEPQYKMYPDEITGAVNPKCPFCNEQSDNVTNKCLEITQKNNIDEMVNWNNVRTYEEVYGPISDDDDDTMSVDGGPLSVGDLIYDDSGTGISQNAMDLLIHAIDLLQQTLEHEIPKRITEDIAINRNNYSNNRSVTAFMMHQDRFVGYELYNNYGTELGNTIRSGYTNINYTIDTYDKNFTDYLNGIVEGAGDVSPVDAYKQVLTEIKNENRDRGTLTVQSISRLKEFLKVRLFTGQMKQRIFEKTTYMNDNVNSGIPNIAFLADMLYSIVTEQLNRLIDRIVLNMQIGGRSKRKTKKTKRKRRNTKKKRRGGGNELSQESINKDIKDMRTSLQQTFVPTGPREHRSKSNLDAITLGNFKIQDKEAKRLSKKSKRKK